MLGSLLFLFVLLAFVAALVGGIFLGLGGIFAVVQDAWDAFRAGLSGESVVK